MSAMNSSIVDSTASVSLRLEFDESQLPVVKPFLKFVHIGSYPPRSLAGRPVHPYYGLETNFKTSLKECLIMEIIRLALLVGM